MLCCITRWVAVGRRLSNTVKKQLYRVLILQDVAFYDGNSTGHLTSRLSEW